MSEIIRVFDLITEESIAQLRDQISAFHRKSDRLVRVFADNTIAEGFIAERAMAEAIKFYREAENFPNLCTIAGPDVWHAGFMIFLAGRQRRLMPNASFKINWNETTATILAAETKKDPDKILRIFNGKSSINAFQFIQLGISHGYYIGILPEFHEAVIRKSRAPK